MEVFFCLYSTFFNSLLYKYTKIGLLTLEEISFVLNFHTIVIKKN